MTDGSVETATAVKRILGYDLETVLQALIVNELGPHVGIGCNHTVKREHLAAAGLVHQLQPDADILILTLLDNTVTELGMICAGHLLYVEEHAAVTYYIM